MRRAIAALGLAILAVAGAAAPAIAAADFPPSEISFRPGSASVVLVLDTSRRPRL